MKWCWVFLLSLFLFVHNEIHAYTKPFFSKKDGLSVQPPHFFNKPRIHQERHDGDLFITMIDDMGTLFRLEKLCMDPSMQELPTDALFTEILECMTYTIKQVIPDTKVLKQEIVELNDKKTALFCLFDFPKGSILENMDTKEKIDSMRGHLIFLEGDKCIVLGYQTDLTFTSPELFLPNTEDVYQRYRASLIEAANSFKIDN